MTQETSTETFDAGAFMQSTVDQPMATEYELCPEGTFQAMVFNFDETAIEKVDFEYQKGPRRGEPGTMVKFNCPFNIQDPAVLAQMERDMVIVEWQMILDRNAQGGLDWGKGKNVKLGQLRAALGQNNAGVWNIAQLVGAGPLMVKVVHETFKRKDGTTGTAARVVSVAPLR